MTKIKGKHAQLYDIFVKRESLIPDGLQKLVESTGSKRILEFGCGTGTVAIGLSNLGYDVTGVDLSEEMLKIARRKKKLFKSTASFIRGDITGIRLNRTYDLLLCLGNTLPLVYRIKDLDNLLENCISHVKPGGTAIFQMLNYDRILKNKPSTFAIDTTDENIRVKQYKYGKNLIDFFVTIIDISKLPPTITSVSKNKIKPWKKSDISRKLKSAGFKKVRAYENYKLGKFDLESNDLIIIGKI